MLRSGDSLILSDAKQSERNAAAEISERHVDWKNTFHLPRVSVVVPFGSFCVCDRNTVDHYYGDTGPCLAGGGPLDRIWSGKSGDDSDVDHRRQAKKFGADCFAGRFSWTSRCLRGRHLDRNLTQAIICRIEFPSSFQFKTERYSPQMLKLYSAKDHTNIEIILVDDSSPKKWRTIRRIGQIR